MDITDKIDEINFEYYCPEMYSNPVDKDEALELFKYLLRGVPPTLPRSKSVAESTLVNMISDQTRGNVLKTRDSLSQIWNAMGDVQDDCKDQNGAAMMAAHFSSPVLVEEFLQKQKTLNNLDKITGAGIGGDGSAPNVTQDDIKERQMIVSQLNKSKNFRAFLDLFGYFHQRLSRMKREEPVKASNNIVGVELGRNLKALLPSQLRLLALEETEDIFLLKYATKSLLQFRHEEIKPTTGGGFNILIDTSGSTGHSPEGVEFAVDGQVFSPIYVLSAIALACVKDCRDKGKDCQSWQFNTYTNKIHDSKTPMVQVMNKMFGLSPGGSTELGSSILQVLNSDPEVAKNDLIILTDGGFSMNVHEFNLIMKKKRGRIFAFNVGSPNNYDIKSVDEKFPGLFDGKCYLRKLQDLDEVLKIFI